VKERAFAELLASVREAGRIRRGTLRPARVTKFKPADVKALRSRLGQSQTEFALMIGVSVATLRNWEQGRRRPEGPALALLRVATTNPRLVARALHSTPKMGSLTKDHIC
jgi:putative transcriptional regulator